MINLDKEKYQGATADIINDYNWFLKDKILNNLIFGNGGVVMSYDNLYANWDPIALKNYVNDSI